MVLLILSIVILALAPVLYASAMRFQKSWGTIEKIISFLIPALVVIHLLPEAIMLGGYACAGFALVGLFLPSLLERVWERQAEGIHLASLTIGLTGLCLHGLMDGAAMAAPKAAFGTSLPVAILLHRLPDGVLIWAIFRPKSIRLASGLLFCLAAMTIVGFYLGEGLTQNGGNLSYFAYFQALVSGSLLHIAFDRHDGEGEHHHHHHHDHHH